MYKKVVLTQFCIPSLDTLEYKSNVHLAPGYLVGYAKPHLPHTQFIITPRIYTDLLNETAFINYALEQEPDLMVFSLYLWNIDKTLRVVQKIKALSPTMEFLFGGPEVNADNSYLLSSPSFTQGISGEGEIPFLHFLQGKERATIAGYLTPQSFNDSEAIRKDYTLETNPYFENLIETKPDSTMFFETVRGCPFTCNFCYYNKVYSKIISVGREHLAQYFEYARNNNFDELFLLDPTFNVQPDFNGILDDIALLNKDRAFMVATELRADFLTDTQIEKLVAINLVEAEIGLQTTNTKALEAMSRKDRTAETIERTQKMHAAGIHCKVDLIVGLPGDSLADFKQSVDDVFASDLHQMIQVFRLSILPGTEFAVNSKKFGIVADSKPPYYIQSTPTFSYDEINQALRYAEEVFEVNLYPLPPYLLSTDFRGLDPNNFIEFDQVLGKEIEPIHKITFDSYHHNLDAYKSRFSETMVLHFMLNSSTTSNSIVEVLSYFKKNHPQGIYQIILHFTTAPNVGVVETICNALPRSTDSYLEKDAQANLGEYLGVSARLAVLVPVAHHSSNEALSIGTISDLFYTLEQFSTELIDTLYEENSLYFMGESQEQSFDYLSKHDLLDEFTLFESYPLELRKSGSTGQQESYFPTALRFS